MPRSEKQKEKLIRLLEIFMRRTDDKNGLSMPEIIAALEEYGIKAERKSLYDDFFTLSDIGFEVERLPTRPPKYYISEPIFQKAELKLLADAVSASKFITADKSREIIEKLEIFAGKNGARELSRQVYVEGRAKTMNKGTLYAIDAIHEATNDRKKLSFTYFDYDAGGNKVLRHGGAPYRVSPMGLVWDDEKYYLVGIDEDAGVSKNYRVDKMQSVRLLDEPSGAPAGGFDTAEYSRKIFGMYGGEEVAVTLQCDDSLAGVMIDRFGTDIPFIKCKSGFKLTARVMVSPTFFGWLAGFGGRVKILSPDGVSEKYRELLRAALSASADDTVLN